VKYITFVLDSESSIAKYQQYNVLNSSRKRRNLTHRQDPVIHTAACHQHTRPLSDDSIDVINLIISEPAPSCIFMQ